MGASSSGLGGYAITGYATTDVPKAVQLLPVGERRYALATFESLRPPFLMLSQDFELGEGGSVAATTRLDMTRSTAGASSGD